MALSRKSWNWIDAYEKARATGKSVSQSKSIANKTITHRKKKSNRKSFF